MTLPYLVWLARAARRGVLWHSIKSVGCAMCLAASVLWPSDVTVGAAVCSCDSFFRRVVECVLISRKAKK